MSRFLFRPGQPGTASYAVKSSAPGMLRGPERLEPRDVPATLVNANTVTYQDIDGDDVTVTVSKPVFVAATVNQVFTFSSGPGAVQGSNATKEALWNIDLRQLGNMSDAEGASIHVTAKRNPAHGGNGLANVGAILAIDSVTGLGIDLGAVGVAGDLGKVDAGANSTTVPAVASLTADSMGRFGEDTEGGSGGLVSNIEGALGSLAVRHDVVGASIFTIVPGAGIGRVAIGGSLVGTRFLLSGEIVSDGDIGPVRIGRDIQGGNIAASGRLAGVAVGGSLVAGSRSITGFVNGQRGVGPVTIGGDVRGGADESGLIVAGGGGIASVRIGGSLVGGAGVHSGAIWTLGGDIGPVQVGHDILGGSGNESAKIDSAGKLASLTVGGAIVGGSGSYDTFTDGNKVTHFGQVFAVGDMGPVKVTGNLEGGSGFASGSVQTATKLADVTVDGSVVGGTEPENGVIESAGDIGLVRIGGDLSGEVIGKGAVRAVAVGGSIVGGSGIRGGGVFGGRLGPVSVRRDLIGGAGNDSGSIEGTALAGVRVGGSVVGGSGFNAGEIFGGTGGIGAVRVGGDVRGGSEQYCGLILSSAGIASVSIGGSVIGGIGGFEHITGAIDCSQDLGPVTIGGDLVGGGEDAGFILSLGRIAGVTIGGSIIAGTNTSSGTLGLSGAILAGDDIGFLVVKDGIVGNLSSTGKLTPVVISARGQAQPGDTTDLAIGRIQVGGRVEFANILAGYDVAGTPVNGDAQIGAVTVGGDWAASNLIAGMKDVNGDGFGNADDKPIGPGNLDVTASIASVTIGGNVLGTPADLSSTDHFGFEAQQVGAMKVRGIAVPLHAGKGNDVLGLGLTGDVTVREVS